jgi:hypothetical protein
MRAVLIALLLTACVDNAVDAPKSTPPASRTLATGPTLTLAANDPAALDSAPQAAFPLMSLHHLMIRYRVTQLPPGVAWVTLTLEQPGGGIWTTRHLAFSAEKTHARVPSPDGVPHPIEVTVANRLDRGFALDTSILVGGTNLQRRPQFGRWTIRATIDGQPDSAAVAAFDFVR